MQIWNVLHKARWKYRTQKVAKNRHLRIITQLCRAISWQGICRPSEKKIVRQQYLLHISSQYGELRPTSGWDRFVSLGHRSKFERVSRLRLVTTATSLNKSQPNFAQCLTVFWPATLYIHFRGFLPRSGILPGAKFTLRPKLAFSYFGSVTARHSSSGRQRNFVALSKGHHLYLAGRPSRWALAHILVLFCFWNVLLKYIHF